MQSGDGTAASKLPNAALESSQTSTAIGAPPYRLALELFVVERLASVGLSDEFFSRTRAHREPLLHIRADAPVDGAELVRADEAFHLGFARELGNAYIVEALQDINERLRFVRLVVITTPHRVHATAGEHLAVLDALARKNPEAARKALRLNISAARNKVEIALAQSLHPRAPAALSSVLRHHDAKRR